MNWRWLVPATGAVLLFTVAEGSERLQVLLAVLTWASAGYAMAGMEVARTAHFVDGHKEGDVVPQDYRVVTSARQEPIETRWDKQSRRARKVTPERLTRHVSQTLELPAILQTVGLVIYRATEPDARQTETDLHVLLDPLFAEPVETYVERWNDDLDLWQPADDAGGDRATLAALRWEVRIRYADKSAARAAAAQIRDGGEVMVGLMRRNVLIAVPDEASAHTASIRFPVNAGADIRVRPLTRFRRRRLLNSLYDRWRRTSGGWLEYDEPAPA